MTTKQLVQYKFDTMCKLYNLQTTATTKARNPEQPDYYSNNFVRMDFNSHYGGYRIDVVTTGTGERFFDRQGRLSAKEMISYLDGLIAAKSSYIFTKDIIKPSL